VDYQQKTLPMNNTQKQVRLHLFQKTIHKLQGEELSAGSGAILLLLRVYLKELNLQQIVEILGVSDFVARTLGNHLVLQGLVSQSRPKRKEKVSYQITAEGKGLIDRLVAYDLDGLDKKTGEEIPKAESREDFKCRMNWLLKVLTAMGERGVGLGQGAILFMLSTEDQINTVTLAKAAGSSEEVTLALIERMERLSRVGATSLPEEATMVRLTHTGRQLMEAVIDHDDGAPDSLPSTT
jgi:predicted transcriptional regulator